MTVSLWNFIFLLLLPSILSHSRHYPNGFKYFPNSFLRQGDGNSADRSTEGLMSRRQPLFRLFPLNYHHGYFQQPQPQQQQQLTCLPAIWTCGPGLPPCCTGLMCYDGNAKRGRHCVARG